jgi:hypothetical protein
MKTNKEFSELSPEEVKAYFESLTAEEVEQLTKVQKEAYELFIGAPTPNEEKGDVVYGVKNAKGEVTYKIPHESPSTPEEFAANYFAANPEYQFSKVLVADDGTIFPDSLRGKNACDNYGKGLTEVTK